VLLVYNTYVEIGKHEANAHFVAVSGCQVDVERHKLRVENFDVFGNRCFGDERTENGILLSIEHASRPENQAVAGDEAIWLEVRRCVNRNPGLAFAKYGEGVWMLVTAQTLLWSSFRRQEQRSTAKCTTTLTTGKRLYQILNW
jgi:hypothetical protein